MPSNSSVRRAVKGVSHRLLGEHGYGWLQAIAMARDIRAGRAREPELALLAAVRSGDVVVDVGANYGFWTEPMSKAVGPRGRVLAMEPVPFTVTTLRRVVKLMRLRNVEIHAVACGDAPGVLELTVPVQGSGAISAGQAHFASRDDGRPGHEVHVRWPDSTTVTAPVVRLDDVVGDAEVSFLKCDVEGAELQVLRGAADLIERSHPTIVAEINPWFLEGFGLSVDALVSELADIGYELYRLDDARRLVAVAVADVVEDNYVFVHPDRRASFAAFFAASSS